MNVTVAAFLHKMKYVLSLVAVVAICLDLVESGPVIILPPETEIEVIHLRFYYIVISQPRVCCFTCQNVGLVESFFSNDE